MHLSKLHIITHTDPNMLIQALKKRDLGYEIITSSTAADGFLAIKAAKRLNDKIVVAIVDMTQSNKVVIRTAAVGVSMFLKSEFPGSLVCFLVSPDEPEAGYSRYIGPKAMHNIPETKTVIIHWDNKRPSKTARKIESACHVHEVKNMLDRLKNTRPKWNHGRSDRSRSLDFAQLFETAGDYWTDLPPEMQKELAERFGHMKIKGKHCVGVIEMPDLENVEEIDV